MTSRWQLLALSLGLVLQFCSGNTALAAPITIVAAENFYGELATEIAGPDASVVSILNNPDQDPHLFEASPSTARILATAQIVISNGAGYDPWIGQLLRAHGSFRRRHLIVGELMHVSVGANPHLWYDPATMATTASAFADALSDLDPASASIYRSRRDAFLSSLIPLQEKLDALRTRFNGAAVTATEPVFGYMASRLGLQMRNERFQISVMNGSEPRVSDVRAFEADLRSGRVRVLLFNKQATSSAAQRMLQIASAAHVPAVGVSETEPANSTYPSWMLSQLRELEVALDKEAR